MTGTPNIISDIIQPFIGNYTNTTYNTDLFDKTIDQFIESEECEPNKPIKLASNDDNNIDLVIIYFKDHNYISITEHELQDGTVTNYTDLQIIHVS